MANRPNSHTVEVHQPRALTEDDYDRLHAVLGVEPLRVPPPISPWITIDARAHTAASRWLKLRNRQSPSTLEANARDLVRYIDFLVNERGLWHADEALSDIFAVSYDDILAFRHWSVRDARATAGAWNRLNSSIKQFHEFCQIEYQLPLPWTPRKVPAPGRGAFLTSNGLSMRTKRGSAGIPLHPDFVDVLVQAALRLDRDWTDFSGPMARRDLSLIRHGLATGMRNSSLRSTTIYEVPPASNARHGWNQVRVPDATTKGLAGGLALAFEHHLQAVRDYIDGSRKQQVEASIRLHRPAQPLHITEADLQGWTAIDGTTGERCSLTWPDSNEDTRRRLVDKDGSSPVIHLTGHGLPISDDTASRVVEDARRFAQEHITPGFPSVRLHDLRHTYAVHLAVCIFHDRVARAVQGPASRVWRDRTISDAVAAVQASLGHANASTTSIYITHTTQHILSGTPPERYLES